MRNPGMFIPRRVFGRFTQEVPRRDLQTDGGNEEGDSWKPGRKHPL